MNIMYRKLPVVAFLIMSAVTVQSQKSRVLSVIQLIESGKYSEAKEGIELAVWNDKTSGWGRTYYARGLLCQKAYEEGTEKKDDKLTSLYPDQLNVAYSSYEKALDLNPGNRVTSAIGSQYYALANDFQALGTVYYKKKQYTKALDAFEHALVVCSSPLIAVKIDTNLVYNTALAAFWAGEWDQAINHLTGLNDDGYSPESALLLYRAYIHQGDSLEAEKVLYGAIENYEDDQELVLQLADLLVVEQRMEEAVAVLDDACLGHPANPLFPWTRGLIYEKQGMYQEAILSLNLALEESPGEAGINYDLGICYFNLGVSSEEKALVITEKKQYQTVREEARKQFMLAVEYFEKTRELDPEYSDVASRLALLQRHLQLDGER
jgi:tetratricopeptide (TPR) repeat protein